MNDNTQSHIINDYHVINHGECTSESLFNYLHKNNSFSKLFDRLINKNNSNIKSNEITPADNKENNNNDENNEKDERVLMENEDININDKYFEKNIDFDTQHKVTNKTDIKIVPNYIEFNTNKLNEDIIDYTINEPNKSHCITDNGIFNVITAFDDDGNKNNNILFTYIIPAIVVGVCASSYIIKNKSS